DETTRRRRRLSLADRARFGQAAGRHGGGEVGTCGSDVHELLNPERSGRTVLQELRNTVVRSQKSLPRRTRRTRTILGLLLGVLCVLRGEAFIHAQIQMPDPKQMSGIPRPDGQMTPGTVTVRLIRGDLSNNITGHPVELHVGDKVQTVKTDDQGRAEFSGLTPGATATAVAEVDGEH